MELQKASMWKRVSAWILDMILLCIVASGFVLLLSLITRYDTHYQQLNSCYARYEEEYNVKFDIPADEYNAFSEEEKQRYDDALAALIADEDAVRTYNLVVNLTLLMTSLGIFFACMLLEFILPKIFDNGQTVGKKVFGLCLVAPNAVRVNTPMLFIRALLGKYTIEIMIPVLIAVMVFFNAIGIVGPIVVGLILLFDIVLIALTRNNTPIHDCLAGTVVVDMASQRIFDSEADLIAYKQRLAAERAQQQEY